MGCREVAHVSMAWLTDEMENSDQPQDNSISQTQTSYGLLFTETLLALGQKDAGGGPRAVRYLLYWWSPAGPGGARVEVAKASTGVGHGCGRGDGSYEPSPPVCEVLSILRSCSGSRCRPCRDVSATS
jgi:hypothetical protein